MQRNKNTKKYRGNESEERIQKNHKERRRIAHGTDNSHFDDASNGSHIGEGEYNL